MSMSDIRAFRDLEVRLFGVEDMQRVTDIPSPDADTVAKMMLAQDDQEDLARQKAALAPPKAGRPSTPRRHLWVMATIEAYIGAGLSRKVALNRAADKWEIGNRYIEDIYKGNKLPQHQSKHIRAYFAGHTVAEIDEVISEYLKAERLARE